MKSLHPEERCINMANVLGNIQESNDNTTEHLYYQYICKEVWIEWYFMQNV